VRLFVGVFPPASVRDHLRRALPSGLKLTAVGQWHVTLAFLGEVAEERLAEVELALDRVSGPHRASDAAERTSIGSEQALGGLSDAAEGATSGRHIELSLAGGGRFANGRSVALWAGVTGDLTGLSGLRAEICAALTGYNDRPFRPHLTIAYTRGGQALEMLQSYAGPTWTVDEFVLVRSRYNEGGGYDHLRSWTC